MKRKLLGCLCVYMLLSGCGVNSSNPLQTEIPTIAIFETEVSNIPLLEQGILLEECCNLLYIPNETIEGMINPEMRLLGNGLLISECVGNELGFKHISLEDGALVAEGSVTASSRAKLYIGNSEIGLYDREFGLISILDETFRLQRTYDVANESDEWDLNSELDTL